MPAPKSIGGLPFNKWKKELILTGKVVQDEDDEDDDDDDAQTRDHRYVELLKAVKGKEGEEVFQAVLDSVHNNEDYGIYESAYTALWRFPQEKIGEWFVRGLPAFIRRMPAAHRKSKVSRHVGRMMCGLTSREVALRAFNTALAQAPPKDRKTILDWIRNEEKDGWFSKHKGVLGAEVGD
jgi:hypothetical protein